MAQNTNAVVTFFAGSEIIENKLHVARNEAFQMKLHHEKIITSISIQLIIENEGSDNIFPKRCKKHQKMPSSMSNKDNAIIEICGSSQNQVTYDGEGTVSLNPDFTTHDISLMIMCDNSCDSIRFQKTVINIEVQYAPSENNDQPPPDNYYFECHIHPTIEALKKFVEESANQQAPLLETKLHWNSREDAIEFYKTLIGRNFYDMSNASGEEKERIKKVYQMNKTIYENL